MKLPYLSFVVKRLNRDKLLKFVDKGLTRSAAYGVIGPTLWVKSGNQVHVVDLEDLFSHHYDCVKPAVTKMLEQLGAESYVLAVQAWCVPVQCDLRYSLDTIPDKKPVVSAIYQDRIELISYTYDFRDGKLGTRRSVPDARSVLSFWPNPVLGSEH